ncbi:MAG: pyridoxal phosphate-dependent aminotransferase [Acidobacteriota bacterium]
MSKATFQESHYVSNVEVSSTAKVLATAERLRAEGVDIVDLGAGEPDFPTPENVKAAAIRAIEENFTRYTSTGGIAPLKTAVIEMMQRDFDVTYKPSETIITIGGKQGIFNAMAAVVNAGDEVLIPVPYWVTYPEIVKFLRANPVAIETEMNDFVLTADMVREAITPKSKLLIINSPSNPSGRVIPPAEFRKIIEVAAEHDLWVISDECYLYFAYPPAAPFTAGTLPKELRDRVLISGSFSKSYAMTGWRVGYNFGNEAWIHAMLKIQSHSTSNAASMAQKAAIEAALGQQESMRAMLAEYQRRRDYLIPALNKIEGIECLMPEGAFYAFPKVKGLLGGRVKTSAELADLLLTDAYVVVTEGAPFGSEGYLRLSYANSLENIQKAVERIAEVSEKLRKE